MLTVSKAWVISIATAIVRAAGFFWLNPCVMVCVILCRAVVVECSAL